MRELGRHVTRDCDPGAYTLHRGNNHKLKLFEPEEWEMAFTVFREHKS
jgi:hypothetical protein